MLNITTHHKNVNKNYSEVSSHTGQNQFSSVDQSCPTLRSPMNHSTPGLPVHHQLPEFTQTHVQGNSGAKTIQQGKDSLTNGDGATEYSHIKE